MNITVCIGSSCHIKGSREIVDTFQNLISEYKLGDKAELSGTFCMGNCRRGVCVTIDGEIFSVSPETAADFFVQNIANRLK